MYVTERPEILQETVIISPYEDSHQDKIRKRRIQNQRLAIPTLYPIGKIIYHEILDITELHIVEKPMPVF